MSDRNSHTGHTEVAIRDTRRRRPAPLCLAVLQSGLLLAGCTAIQPKIVVDETGLQAVGTTGSLTVLQAAYDAAIKAPQDTAASHDLVKAGTSVAYQLCSSFFKTAGKEQQILLFSRDVVGIVGTVATGVLGATHASPAATAWLGIGSGAGLSAISIYSRNFLFSEDNVQAVQNLTLTAMSNATKEALSGGRDPYDFLTAVQAIMDVQAVCEVQNILSLVRQSINTATPNAVPSVSGRISVSVAGAAVAPRSGPVSHASSAKQIRDWLHPNGTIDPGRRKQLEDWIAADKTDPKLAGIPWTQLLTDPDGADYESDRQRAIAALIAH